MSDGILLHGKRGNGKSLGALFFMRRYMERGCTVATNIDLYLDKLLSPRSKAVAYRLPDHPSAADLEALPLGNPALYYDEAGEIQSKADFDEQKNGLLVLDEIATFLNSREWQGKERAAIIAWLVQSRKYGWDLLFLVQHPRMIDAQIREALIDIQGSARRLDKVRVPFLSPIWKWATGQTLRFPKIHILSFFYGFDRSAPLWDRFWFFGKNFYPAYNTRQRISAITGNQATFTYLSPWLVRGRHMGFFQMYKKAMAASAVLGFLVGGAFGFVGAQPSETVAQAAAVPEKVSDITVSGVMRGDGMPKILLSNGNYGIATAAKADASGERFLVDGQWHRIGK